MSYYMSHGSIDAGITLTFISPQPEVLSMMEDDKVKLMWLSEICRGCRSAVASICLRGVANPAGWELMGWWKVFFTLGIVVGGEGVADGVGALMWLMITGIKKS